VTLKSDCSEVIGHRYQYATESRARGSCFQCKPVHLRRSFHSLGFPGCRGHTRAQWRSKSVVTFNRTYRLGRGCSHAKSPDGNWDRSDTRFVGMAGKSIDEHWSNRKRW